MPFVQSRQTRPRTGVSSISTLDATVYFPASHFLHVVGPTVLGSEYKPSAFRETSSPVVGLVPLLLVPGEQAMHCMALGPE